MKLPFEQSLEDIFEFIELLKSHNLDINKGSDLDVITTLVLEAAAKYKKQIAHDDSIDIRKMFSDIAGISDFVKLILKHREHPDFAQVVPHLHLLNKANTATMTTQSKVTDAANNKLMELYIALLCMSFAQNIQLDHPENSKGDNPDVMFEYEQERWAIACKAIHSKSEKTLYDTIAKGTGQIDRSDATKGFVVVNFKNIINTDEVWPILNMEEFKNNKSEPDFACFDTGDIPIGILRSYTTEAQHKLTDTIGTEQLLKLSESGKTPNGFLVFLQAMTSYSHEGQCPAVILKLFNWVEFDGITLGHMEVARKLNEAMHHRI